MKTLITTVLALVVTAGSAFAQTFSVDAVPGMQREDPRPGDAGVQWVSERECRERYAALRARSQMRPSERRRALALCRMAARAGRNDVEVAGARD